MFEENLKPFFISFYQERGFVFKKKGKDFYLYKEKENIMYIVIFLHKRANQSYMPMYGIRNNKIENILNKTLYPNRTDKKFTTSITVEHNNIHNLLEPDLQHQNKYFDNEIEMYQKFYEKNIFRFFKKYETIEGLEEFFVQEKGIPLAYVKGAKYAYQIIILKIMNKDYSTSIQNFINFCETTGQVYYKEMYPYKFNLFKQEVEQLDSL